MNSRVPYNTTVECGTSVSSFGQVSWLSVLTSEVHKETQGKQSKGIVSGAESVRKGPPDVVPITLIGRIQF